MNLWIRIYAVQFGEIEASPTGVSIPAPRLSITIYPSEEPAREAMEKHGGLVLSVTADSLKPLLEVSPVHFANGGVKHVATCHLSRAEDFEDDDAGFFQDHLQVWIDYSALPHTHKAETFYEGTEHEFTNNYPVFAAEALGWIEQVEAELNALVMS
jgi:hypothetical protein